MPKFFANQSVVQILLILAVVVSGVGSKEDPVVRGHCHQSK